jgi:peroxiredoxin
LKPTIIKVVKIEYTSHLKEIQVRHITFILSLIILSFAFTRTINASSSLSTIEITNTDPSKICALNVGSTISSELKIRDINGESHSLKKIISKRPTIIVFYRGGWCPFCNLQLQNLRKVVKDVESTGFQLIAISPDRPSELKKSLGKHKLTYKLLSDSSANAAKQFGIAFKVNQPTLKKYEEHGINLEKASGKKHNLLPVPSVFILNKDGKVHFSYANPDYKVRLDEEIILAAMKNLKIK